MWTGGALPAVPCLWRDRMPSGCAADTPARANWAGRALDHALTALVVRGRGEDLLIVQDPGVTSDSVVDELLATPMTATRPPEDPERQRRLALTAKLIEEVRAGRFRRLASPAGVQPGDG
jgi:hypothetical protein